MGLPAAALCIVGTLVLAVASQDADLQVRLFPPCSATLAPQGPCEQEGDGCPFVLNLPPMTVNLPKQLLDLERLVEELQMLKDNVDELRKICKGCAASQAEKECARGAERGADNGTLDVNAQIRENDKRVVNEKRGKNGKILVKDKMEQVVAAGKNVRITERKKLDRKQIARDGGAKGALDKQNSALGNVTHVQNRTFGKSELWRDQMMDSKRQAEAADEMEDGGVKLSNENAESDRQNSHVKTILGEKDTKSDHQTKDQEDAMKKKDGTAKPSSRDSSNRHIWQDKHLRTSHEDGAEKNFGNTDKGGMEQPLDWDRPVWRDKTHVDMNQMERIEERGGETSDASEEGGNTPKSSQSGHHVWRDETMETSSSAEKIKLSVSGSYTGHDHRTNGEVNEGGEQLRENRKLMEGTDLHSGGQASVVNSVSGRGFIDLDGPVTLTSPPSFTATHMTTDVKRGQKEQNNGKGSAKEQLRPDAGLADGEKLENGGETNVEDGQLEQPDLEIQPSYNERKADVDIEQHRPTKTTSTVITLDTSSNSDLSTDLINVQQNTKKPPKNVGAKFEQTNNNKQFAKRVKPPTKIANRSFTTGSTTSDSSRNVIKGEEKSTSRPLLQTTKEENTYAEDSNLDAKSSPNKMSRKDSNHNKTKLSIPKRVRTKDSSSTTTSPTTSNAHDRDVKRGPKTAFGRPTPNNPNKKKSDTTDASLHEQMTKLSSEDPKSGLTVSTSDTTSNSESYLTDFKQENLNEPASQDNYNKMNSKNEHPSSNSQINQPIATTATPKLSKIYLTKDTKHGDKKSSYSSSQNKPNEKPRHPLSSNIDTQLSKTKNQLTTVALSEDSNSFTPTPPNSHLGKDVKQQQIPDDKEKSQSIQGGDKHSSHFVDVVKAKAKDEQYVTISTPATSNFEQENQNTFNGKLSQSEREIEHSSINAQFTKATSKPNAVNEDAGSLNLIASNSEITTYNENIHEQTPKDIASKSNINKDLETESLSFDVSAEVISVRTMIAEDATISTPTTSKPRFNPNSNQGQQETTHKKTHYGQPSTNYNEKDSNSIQNGQIDTYTSQPPSVLVEDITGHHASFKDDITSTTIASHQISPTTMFPPILSRKKKLNISKSLPNQKTKPNSGKKPEANLKQKNPKNDRKPDRTPLPDTQVKNDRRQMHPKGTPGIAPQPTQIPPESDQSTQLQVNNKDNPLQKVIVPAQAPTDSSTMTGLQIDERKRANATSVHDRRPTMDSEIDKASNLKQFFKKTGIMKNNTGSVLIAQNRSSEFNGTKAESKKSSKINLKIPKMNLKPKPQVPKNKTAQPKLESNQKVKVEQAPKPKIPKVNTFADLKNNSKLLPGSKQSAKPVKSKIIPPTKIKQTLKVKEKIAKTYAAPTSGPIEMTTLNPRTAHDLEADPLRQNDTTLDSLTMNSNSGVISSKGPQTTAPVPSIALTTEPNKATQVSDTLPTKSKLNKEKSSPGSPFKVQLRPTMHTIFRSTAPPAPPDSHAGAKVPAVENTTPSARELRVKINQVAAFLNKSSQQRTPLDKGPGEQKEDDTKKKPDVKPDVMVVRDCSDHVLRGHTKSGPYLVTPDPSGSSVLVLCDMEEDGGGWTVLQRRHDGSVNFNRSWASYRDGFGELDGGEFWLGNNLIHLLTQDRSMELRVELEDFEGVREYAQYEFFKVASERMRFRLTVDGYSGTAGDALRFNSKYTHNNRAFTTPDRDNDRYPSGNCGAYYSSGWWFDACMAANLNGRYYKGKYKGVRDGIYWGTWHNISTEYYPTNERLSFKTVRMMIRPKGFKP